MKHVALFFWLAIMTCGLGWYIDYLAHDELTTAARWLIAVIAISGGAAAITTTVVLALILVERFRMTRARRKEVEKNAAVMVVTAGHSEQVYIRDDDTRATWRQAHLDPRVIVDNRMTLPTETEYWAWGAFHTPRVETAAVPALMPGVMQVDLLTILDTAQCALIVGQRDSGKTTLLLHAITRRLTNSHVLILDPHTWPGRWPNGCQVIGAERNFAAIGKALRALESLMNQRYREIGKGLVREGEHERVTVVIDEWRAVVHQLGKPAADIIKTLLAESRKTNIDIFVGSHSERVKALGIEGEGDLKEGFVMVRLTINKATMQRSATVDYGDGEIEVTLPGPYRAPVAFINSSQPVIEHDQGLDMSEPEPDDTEQQVLDMAADGASKTAIANAIFGGDGGNQLRKVADILNRFASVNP